VPNVPYRPISTWHRSIPNLVEAERSVGGAVKLRLLQEDRTACVLHTPYTRPAGKPRQCWSIVPIHHRGDAEYASVARYDMSKHSIKSSGVGPMARIGIKSTCSMRAHESAIQALADDGRGRLPTLSFQAGHDVEVVVAAEDG
jgi:hypothetical protein